jgi:hypothetical protein
LSRSAKLDLISFSLLVSSVKPNDRFLFLLNRSEILVQLSSKIESLLTLKFIGERHDKGFAEDADMKASGGVI